MRKQRSRRTKPKISVLMATYNRPEPLREAVASVLNQTFHDFDLIVVNDGGEDVRDILSAFNDERIIYIPLKENRGKSHALNRALEIARTPYIAYLDDDDHYFPHHLQTLLAGMESHPDVDLVYSDFDELHYQKGEGNSREVISREVIFSKDFDRQALFKENYIPHPTVLHRRELFRRAGIFDESLSCLIDWDLLRRFAFFADFWHLPVVTGEYFINQDESDHITNLYQRKRTVYLETLRRIRRTLPAGSWSKVRPATLFVRPSEGGEDLSDFLHRLVNVSYYPCEVYVLSENGALNDLPGRDWLKIMNVKVLPVGPGEKGIKKAALVAWGDLVVTLQTDFRPLEGWLFQLVNQWENAGKAIYMTRQPSSTPWGWALDREMFIKDQKSWIEASEEATQFEGICRVSVIIPVRNKLNFTRGCLDSIRKTVPPKNHEVIVVDNASDDGSREFLMERECYGELTWLRNDPPLPFAASCNRGAEMAAGEFLLFLNNDTQARSGWLNEMVSTAERDPQVGAVGAKLLYPDGKIQHAGVVFHHFKYLNRIGPYHIFRTFPTDHAAVNREREFQAVTGACLLTPKSVFEETGGFDDQFINCFEDVDYCLRLREKGYRIVYQPRAQLIHYEGQTPGRNDYLDYNLDLLLSRWDGKLRADDQEIARPEGFKIDEPGPGLLLMRPSEEINEWFQAVKQLVELRQWKMALEEIEKIEAVIVLEQGELLEQKGVCLLELGDVEGARNAFTKAKILKPKEPGPNWGLARIALLENRSAEARSRIRRLLSQHPDHQRRRDWQAALEKVEK